MLYLPEELPEEIKNLILNLMILILVLLKRKRNLKVEKEENIKKKIILLILKMVLKI